MLPLLSFASFLEFKSIFPTLALKKGDVCLLPNQNVFVSVFGVGMLEFSKNMTTVLSQKKYAEQISSVISVGIAGAFENKKLALGDVLRIDEEQIGDLGVEENSGIFEPWSKIEGISIKYKASSVLEAPLFLRSLRAGSGITVNCCSGTQMTAARRCELFNAEIETMEGAAGLALGQAFGIPAYEIRAISNYVGNRDKTSWKIQEALEALKQVLAPLIL